MANTIKTNTNKLQPTHIHLIIVIIIILNSHSLIIYYINLLIIHIHIYPPLKKIYIIIHNNIYSINSTINETQSLNISKYYLFAIHVNYLLKIHIIIIIMESRKMTFVLLVPLINLDSASKDPLLVLMYNINSIVLMYLDPNIIINYSCHLDLTLSDKELVLLFKIPSILNSMLKELILLLIPD